MKSIIVKLSANLRVTHFIIVSFLILVFYEIHFGLSFLNPFCLSWLFDHPSDLVVNFTGWDFFRNEPWSFPIGQIQNYFYPLGTNIYMTDIPLVALPLKLLSPILPAEQFQYVGIWLLVGHLLQAWFAILLCERFEIMGFRRIVVCMFLVFCPIFLVRFEHATLYVHWMILASFYVYFMDPLKTALNRIILSQLILVVISALIMLYVWFMVVGFAAALLLRLWLIDKKIKYYHVFLLMAGQVLFVLLLWLGIGLISFGPLPDYQGGGWGEYSMNLNSFFNPVNTSAIFSSLPHFAQQAFEGYSYLGAGVLLLIGLALGLFLVTRIPKANYASPGPRESAFVSGIHIGPLVLFLAGCFLFALSCNISFNQHLLFHYELKGLLLKIANSFRASGRFSWPVYYLILLMLFSYINRIKLAPVLKNSILAGCFVIQVYELQQLFLPIHTAIGNYRPPIHPFWEKLIQSFDRIIFYPGFARSYLEADDYKYFTYYAGKYQKKINAGYVARFDYGKAEQANREVSDKLLSAGLEDNTLYVTTLPYINRLSIPIENKKAFCLNLGGYIAVFGRGSKTKKLFSAVASGGRDSTSREIEWTPHERKGVSQLPIAKKIKMSVLAVEDTEDHFYVRGWAFSEQSNDIPHDSIQLIFASRDNRNWNLPAFRFNTEGIATEFHNPNVRRVGFGATLPKSKLGKGVYRVGLHLSNSRTGFTALRWTDTLITVFRPLPPMIVGALPVKAEELRSSIDITQDNEQQATIVGWAFPGSGQCANCKKFLVLSSSKTKYLVEFFSQSRPDVVSFFKDTSRLLSGVRVNLKKHEVSPGVYNVGVLLRDTLNKKEFFTISDKIVTVGASNLMLPAVPKKVPTSHENSDVVTVLFNIGGVAILFYLLLLLTDVAFQPLSKALPEIKQTGFSFDLFICFTTCLALYGVFFYFAPWFTTLNSRFPVEDFTPQFQPYIIEHDGMESYLLFAFMPAAILFTMLASWLSSSIGLVFGNKKSLLVIALTVLITLIYSFQIGWNPPMADVSTDITSVVALLLVLSMLLVLLFLVNRYNSNLTLAVAALLLLPVCFISVQPVSSVDYSFIWAPAYRLLNGFSIDEIYFQYDLLLSLLAAAWMKFHFDLRDFQLIGQLSFYLFFIFLLIFSRALFHNKHLWIPFFMFLIILRCYAIMHDPTYIFQVTPLRLDLWLLLIMIFYHKGPRHWSVGVTLGAMLVLHRNFGTIYLVCYVELLAWLLINDFISSSSHTFRDLLGLVRHHLLSIYQNCLILLGCIILSLFLFKGLTPESAVLYGKIGIGMLPISKQSFYWYVPVLLSLTSILLFRYRAGLSSAYFTSASFIIFLAIGNSLYFFGRSHEHNILNISAILSLTLFLFFDLLFFRYRESVRPTRFKKYMAVSLPFLALALTAYFYSNRIINRVVVQLDKVRNGDFAHTMDREVSPQDLALVKELTANSSYVYFLDFATDFQFNYYGHYKPLGYFSPGFSWMFSKDMFQYLQSLLDDGYYVVIGPSTLKDYKGIFPLHYTREEQKGGFMVIKKD